jgi:hypothetical protein
MKYQININFHLEIFQTIHLLRILNFLQIKIFKRIFKRKKILNYKIFATLTDIILLIKIVNWKMKKNNIIIYRIQY